MLKVCLGSDHRGVHIKSRLIQTLTQNGFAVTDAGTESRTAVDYPDFAVQVARMVSRGDVDRGILICGTGIGMAIAANKFPGVRAAPCYDEVMVEMSRRHNDVNVLCLPGDLIGDRPVDELVLMWLRTEFEGGRHAKRVRKIVELESEMLQQIASECAASKVAERAAPLTQGRGTPSPPDQPADRASDASLKE